MQASGFNPPKNNRVNREFFDFLRMHYQDEEYGNSGTLQLGDPIRVDKHDSDDVPRLLCPIEVTLSTFFAQKFILTMERAPMLQEVRDLVVEKGHRSVQFGPDVRADIRIELSVSDHEFLENLAAIYDEIRNGKISYKDKNFRWVSERVQEALYNLAGRLRSFQQSKTVLPEQRT